MALLVRFLLTPRQGAWVLAGSRLPLTTTTRMLAPLLGTIAAGLGVSVAAAGTLVAVYESAGFVGPAAGALVDRLGTRLTLNLGLGLSGVAGLAASTAPPLWVFAICLAAMGVAMNVCEAASTVWLSASSPYEERATWMGRFEVAWPGGLLVGFPIVGALSLWSWRAPFAAVGIGSFVAIIAVQLFLVRAHVDKTEDRRIGREWAPIRKGWAAIVSFAAVSMASFPVIVVFGVWLEDQFDFTVRGITIVGIVIGVGDLVSGVTTIKITDRIGKIRAAAYGLTIMIAASVVLASFSTQLAVGVLALLAMIMGYEYALLATKPLLTEVDPDARGLAIGLGFGLGALARAGGALIGSFAYDQVGMHASALASGAVALVALALLAVVNRSHISG